MQPSAASCDAVGAELVAADHDPHIGLERRRPHGWIAQGIVAFKAPLNFQSRGLLAVQAEGELRPSSFLDLRDQLGQAGKLARAANDIDMRRPPADQLLVLLRHAAQHAHNLARMPLLVSAQPAQRAINLVLGMLTDAAGVEQNDIGLGGLMDQLIALPAQTSHDQLAVEHVHLAADGFDVEFFGHNAGVFYSCSR